MWRKGRKREKRETAEERGDIKRRERQRSKLIGQKKQEGDRGSMSGGRTPGQD
jgi:hypothetical protein